MSPPTKPTLLTLPGEVRNKIWNMACTDEDDNVADINTKDDTSPFAVLGVCKQMRAEARHIILRHVDMPLHPATNLLSRTVGSALRGLTIPESLTSWFASAYKFSSSFQDLEELTIIWPPVSKRGTRLPPKAPKDYPFVIKFLTDHTRYRPHSYAGQHVGNVDLRPLVKDSTKLIDVFPIEDAGKVEIREMRKPEPVPIMRAKKTQVAAITTLQMMEQMDLPLCGVFAMWMMYRGRRVVDRGLFSELEGFMLRRGDLREGSEAVLSFPGAAPMLAEFDAFDGEDDVDEATTTTEA